MMLLPACASQKTDIANTAVPEKVEPKAIAVSPEPIEISEDPNLSLAAAPEVSGPEAERDAELASTPEISPSSLSSKTSAMTQPPSNIWDRVRAGLEFNVPDNKRLRLQRDWYERNQAYMDRVIDRATPFLHYIVEQLEARNMPLDLALLPIVESAFDPFAYSHGRASGMWQFIPSTGKNYGLKQNWWYDGRRDVIESTRAAIDYLSYLHGLFGGDWMHALAAYNSGEGNVMRAIKRNLKRGKPTDCWNLRLPRETRAYVPKLLALADLLGNESKFKLSWKPVENKPVIKKVDIGGQLDIALAAKLAGLSVEDFYKLNPGLNRWSTPPKGPHHILLPIEKVELFEQNLAGVSEQDRVRWVRYTIKSGDSLIKIANSHNTTVSALRSVNGINGNMIRVGQSLMIPTASDTLDSYSLSADQRLTARQNVQRGDQKLTYKVKSGDSFWKIAQSHKISHRKLAAWNGMAPTDPLKIGQELVIWTKSPTTQKNLTPPDVVAIDQSTHLRKINYRVRRGDSLARISNKFSVTVNDLKKWNNKVANRKYLQPGDRLTLYVDIRSQSGY